MTMKNLNILTELTNKVEKTQNNIKKKSWLDFFSQSKKDKKIENLLKKLP